MAEWLQVLTAREAGYSDQEILDHLAKQEKVEDRVSAARQQGYSNDEILQKLAKKIGGVEAFGIGAADGVTFNMTDELTGIGAYYKKMKDQGHEQRLNPLADEVTGAVTKPAADLFSPISGVLSFPLGGGKKDKPAPVYATPEFLAETKAAREAGRRPETLAEYERRTGRKGTAPGPTLAEAKRTADAYALQEREGVRHAQDRARQEETGAYITGTVAGSVVPLAPAVKLGGVASKVPGVSRVAPIVTDAGKRVSGAMSRVIPAGVRTAAANSARVLPAAARSAIGDITTTVGKGAGLGAGYGALAGFGDARGGMDERFAGAMSGAGQGAMWGSALAPVVRYGIGGAGALVREKFGRSDADKAKTMIVRRMREDGTDIDALVDDFVTGADDNVARTRTKAKTRKADDLITEQDTDAVAAWLARFKNPGKEEKMRPRASSDTLDETVGELTGQGTRDLQTALATRPGPGKEIAARTYLQRGQETGKRVNAAFADALKAEGDEFYDEAARLRDKRMNDPKEPYQAAYGTTVQPEAWKNILNLFRERQRFRKALPKAAQFAEDFGRVSIRNELARFENELDDWLRNGDGTQTSATGPKPLSTEALDYLERMVGDEIEYVASKSPAQAAAMAQARDALRGQLPPELNDARRISAAGFDTERALQEGRQAFQSGVDFEEIVARLRDSTPAAKDAYVKGVARGIYDMFTRQRDLGGLADATNRIAGTDLQRQKLMELLPKTKTGKPSAAAQRLLDRLDRESRMAGNAKAALGNSQTAARQAAIEAAEEGDTLDNIAALIAERLTGQGGTMGEKAGRYVVDKVRQPGIRNPNINRELANRLFATGREPVLAVLKELRDHNRKVAPQVLTGKPERFAVRAGSRVAGQQGAAADPYANDAPAAQSADIVEAVTTPSILAIVDPSTPAEERAAAQAAIEAALDTPERWEQYVALLAAYGLEPLGEGPGGEQSEE